MPGSTWPPANVRLERSFRAPWPALLTTTAQVAARHQRAAPSRLLSRLGRWRCGTADRPMVRGRIRSAVAQIKAAEKACSRDWRREQRNGDGKCRCLGMAHRHLAGLEP